MMASLQPGGLSLFFVLDVLLQPAWLKKKWDDFHCQDPKWVEIQAEEWRAQIFPNESRTVANTHHLIVGIHPIHQTEAVGICEYFLFQLFPW